MSNSKKYIQTIGRGLFDAMDGLTRIDSMGDMLANFRAVMDWQIFLPVLDSIPRRQAAPAGAENAGHHIITGI